MGHRHFVQEGFDIDVQSNEFLCTAWHRRYVIGFSCDDAGKIAHFNKRVKVGSIQFDWIGCFGGETFVWLYSCVAAGWKTEKRKTFHLSEMWIFVFVMWKLSCLISRPVRRKCLSKPIYNNKSSKKGSGDSDAKNIDLKIQCLQI